jgi:hypothetical protein
MTEPRERPGRVDLRALDPLAGQAERVVAAVMARLASRPQRPPVPEDVLALVGKGPTPAWIAVAAALLIAASAALISRTAARSASLDRVVATWVGQQHVPTNGELLLAFQGYGR